jgi:uncharacterized coiled-coil protein SlyX
MSTQIRSTKTIERYNARLQEMTNEKTIAEISQSITDGKAKLSQMANDFDIPLDIFKNWLNQTFQNKLEYRRGAKGGIFWIKE